ncbi:MAG: protein kinase [Myxococcota bacterium]|nr:protein kinase [Myxococcota bacterium]
MSRTSRPGDELGRYKVVAKLATGGMAEILLAKLSGPGGFERAVVIKRVLPHLAEQPGFREMFLDEAWIMSGLHHPNVVQVIELSEHESELVLVMEYLAGETLHALLRELAHGEVLPPALAAHLVSEIAAGLHAAHELRGASDQPLDVVHRDVSPQNVFVTYAGAVKLLDFGIARFGGRTNVTSTGEIKGKFTYMSPEQIRGERVDRRTDLWALGVVLWELCTGARLFQRANELLSFKAIVEEPIPRPSARRPEHAEPLPPALEAIIMRALERDRAARYATASEMQRDLLAFVRASAGTVQLDQQCAALMERHFAERIDEKAELLRRVQAGQTITHVPAADLDRSAEDDAPPPIPARSDDSPRTRHRSIAAAIALVGALALAITASQLPGATSTDAAIASVPAPAAVPSSPTPPTEPPPRAQTARVRVSSQPPGAEVELDGSPRGTTPLSLELPRDQRPHTLVLRMRGRATRERTFVADRDVDLELALPARARSTTRPRRSEFQRW